MESPLGGDAPALQHAYAVTTYCAQGTTVDRAYVMADPSMHKQEFYVATSRSREETLLYATPEIQVERWEYAPGEPERHAIARLAEAAERDRAQTAAHDEALRAELAKLSITEVIARCHELAVPARIEAQHEDAYDRQIRAVEERRGRYGQAVAEREAVEALGLRERRRRLPSARDRERLLGERLAEARAELKRMQPPDNAARREHRVAEQLLAARTAQRLTALAVDPPPFILKELGERPADASKGRVWDRGVESIDRYRREHGIEDRYRALGREPQGGTDRATWKVALKGSKMPGATFAARAGLPGPGRSTGAPGEGWKSGYRGTPARAIEAQRSRPSTPPGPGASRP